MAGLRILLAANLPDARTGGATRQFGFSHDRIVAAGHAVDYFFADAAARYGVRGRWARLTFPVALVRFLRDQLRRGVRYDVVTVHEPSGALLVRVRRYVGHPRIVAMSYGVERRAWELALEERRLRRAGPSLKTRIVYPVTSLWQCAATLRRADHVFCVSNEDREYLCRWLGSGAPPITRVFPAADGGFARAAAGRDYGRGEQLLFAATWRKNKGIEDLVPAFIALAARRPALTLTVLGGGVPPDVVRAAFPASTRERVRCLQTASEEETMAAFATHDVFVLPSLFEGTPLTLMEAMASGLPIVTTSTCGMRDVIRDGENGLLIPIRSPAAIADAVGRLIADRALRERLGRAARDEAMHRYTWDAVAAPVRAVYERLAATQRL